MSTSSPWSTAGYPATVAPLGTALTEDQLGLLWKMADEPILCFDGDRRRPARRLSRGRSGAAAAASRQERALCAAARGAGPGRSGALRRARGGGRSARRRAPARRHAVDARDRGRRARHAGAPRRAGGAHAARWCAASATRRCANTTRRISRRGCGSCWRRSSSAVERAAARRGTATPRAGGWRDFQRRAGRSWTEPWAARPRRRARAAGAAERAASPRSPIVRGFRSALPPREALILLAVINHPWLLETPRRGVRRARVPQPRRRPAAARRAGGRDRTVGRGAAARGAAGGDRGARARAACSPGSRPRSPTRSDWPARAGAAAEDVAQWWTHVVTLHRKQRTLNRELKDAERALGEEPTDANLAWLRDVQGRLSALDGTEAQIEGFGSSVGPSGAEPLDSVCACSSCVVRLQEQHRGNRGSVPAV